MGAPSQPHGGARVEGAGGAAPPRTPLLTIDGNVEFVHVTSVNSVFVSDKIVNKNDDLRIKFLSHSKISAVLYVIYFLFLHFLI